MLEQNYPNLEYIIQDGGSKDGSLDIIRRYENKLTFWESGADGGQSAAINRGFSRAAGDYFMWVNSDDQLAVGCLNKLADILQPGRVVVGKCQIVDRQGELIEKWQSRVNTLRDLLDLKNVWYDKGCIIQPETIFPAALFRAAGGLNEANHLTMDFELWAAFFELDAEFLHVPFEVGVFRRHELQKVACTDAVFRSLCDTCSKIITTTDKLTRFERNELKRGLKDLIYAQQYGTGRLDSLGLATAFKKVLRKFLNATK